MKIRFKVRYRPKGDAPDIPTYTAGETYTFDGPVSEGYAQKYIRLGLAVEAVDEPKRELELSTIDPGADAEIITHTVPAVGEKVFVDFRRPGKYRK
jgi:hypothetical protein